MQVIHMLSNTSRWSTAVNLPSTDWTFQQVIWRLSQKKEGKQGRHQSVTLRLVSIIEEPPGKYYISGPIAKVDCNQHTDACFCWTDWKRDWSVSQLWRGKKRKQILLINCMVLFNGLMRDWTKFKPNPLSQDFWGRSHIGMTGDQDWAMSWY